MTWLVIILAAAIFLWVVSLFLSSSNRVAVYNLGATLGNVTLVVGGGALAIIMLVLGISVLIGRPL